MSEAHMSLAEEDVLEEEMTETNCLEGAYQTLHSIDCDNVS